jgi:hypothetical protein
VLDRASRRCRPRLGPQRRRAQLLPHISSRTLLELTLESTSTLAVHASPAMAGPVLKMPSTADRRPIDVDPNDGEVRVTTEVVAKVLESPGSKHEYILNQYKRGHRIGNGQHGQVYICWDLAKEGMPERVRTAKFMFFCAR